MKPLTRLTVLCRDQRSHCEGGEVIELHAREEPELQHRRLEEVVKRLDGRHLPCGPHRVVGPLPMP